MQYLNSTHQNTADVRNDFGQIHDRAEIAKTQKGIFGIFLKHSRVTVILILMVIMWGLFALFSLPREANPEVQVPVAVVSTVWPGASPTDVERLVTDKLEAKFGNMKDVRNITSSSASSVSTIVVEFEANADLEKSIQLVRDEVKEVTGLPQEAEAPRVTEVRLNDFPIVTFSLVGDLSDRELKVIGDTVKDHIEGISGVSQVMLIGSPEREVEVRVNPSELNRLSISVSDVISAIQQANLTIPFGELKSEGLSYPLRSVGEFESPKDLGRIVVKNTFSGPVLLQDIATIIDQFKDRTSISRLGFPGRSARNTVSLQVFKTAGGNILRIVDAANKKIKELSSDGVIPLGVDVVETNDNSKFIREDFQTLSQNGIQTIILIFLALAPAMALSMALLAMISIPLTFFLSFGLIQWQGATLNSLTLFSLILSLGMLVDVAVVLLDGIHDAMKKGYSVEDSALLSLGTYQWPIFGGVATTIAAFVPMFLVKGIVGEFLQTLPLTISAVLGSSFIVGFIMIPLLSVLIIRGRERQKAAGESFLDTTLFRYLSRKYQPAIERLLREKRRRTKLFGTFIVLFMVSLALLFTGILKTQLFPQVDIDYFVVNIELPQGSLLAETDNVVRQVESLVSQIPELENYVSTIGSSAAIGNVGFGEVGRTSENLATVTVNLKPKELRRKKSFIIADQLRLQLVKIQGANVTVRQLTSGPPTGAPVEVQVLGEELGMLSQIASQIKEKLNGIKGVIDIDSTDEPSPPEFVFKLDHERLGRYNLSAGQVSSVLRSAVWGAQATTMSQDGEDIDVVVRYGKKDVAAIRDIEQLELINFSGDRIPLSHVARVMLAPALEVIRHRDTKRVVNITARNEGRTVREIKSDLDRRLSEVQLPQGYQITQTGEFEEEVSAFTDLYKAMSVAVLLIFFIMVLEFNSYRQPLIILITLPLGFVGVIAGTFLVGLSFGFPTFLGVVALAGIVVNNAIILIDRMNDNVYSRKQPLKEAVAEAGSARLRPVILTTVTTVFGVLPLAFTNEFWRGLSVALASGLIFATILTLFMVPILYYHFEKKAGE